MTETSWLQEALDFLINTGKDESVIRKDADGLEYIAGKRVEKPRKWTLELFTLEGLADFAKGLIAAGADPREIFVAVEGTRRVVLYGHQKAPHFHKDVYCTAVRSIDPRAHVYGVYVPLEQFIEEVNAGYLDTSERRRLLAHFAIAEVTNSTTYSDNSGQAVTKQIGGKCVNEDTLNPFELTPFLTFPDALLPRSYSVRHKVEGDQFLVRIDPVDGGHHEQDVIRKIKDLIRQQLPEEVTVV